MSPNQIILASPSFVSEDGSPVDVTGFPIVTGSADETIAVWGRFDATGHEDAAGQYGVRSITVGTVAVTYAVTNPDSSVATLTGTLTIENEEASTGSMNFSQPMDVPAPV